MFELTESQQLAFDTVCQSEESIVLTGGAGTGKTVLIQHLINEGYAPLGATNKVAKAIGGQTVHSYLAALPTYDEQGEMYFVASACGGSERLVIDEAFMLPKEHIRMLEASDSKIIYVGDANQLPPVGEKQSALLTEEINQVRLTVPMRFGDTIAALGQQVLDAEDSLDLLQAYQRLPKLPVDWDDLILSYTNKQTRTFWESYCSYKGRDTHYIVGDRINIKPSPISTKHYGVVNGDVGEIVRLYRDRRHTKIRVDVDGLGLVNLYLPTLEILEEKERVRLGLIAANKTTSRDFYHAYQPYAYLSAATAERISTVHKAQGCGFPRVAIASDVLSCRDFSTAKALLYTAITRAREVAYRVA